MVPTITVSKETYSRIEKAARPFVDSTPESVILHLLDANDYRKQDGSGTKNESASRKRQESLGPADRAEAEAEGGSNVLLPLSMFTSQRLGNRKPSVLEVNGEQISVRSWTDVSEAFVRWLVTHGVLRRQHLPLLNYSRQRDKYYISTKEEHLNPQKDGRWIDVEGFKVDIKYSAVNHVKNMITTLDQLGEDSPKVKMALR
jgi:hypothetical protein